MQIRPDYFEVQHPLSQFVLFAETFDRFNMSEWGKLKNQHDFDQIYGLPYEDRRLLEDIYADGRDLAVHMSEKLVAFNWPDQFPSLKAYVDSFKGTWVDQRELLRAQSQAAKEKRTELGPKCPQAIGWMIDLFDRQLGMLDEVAATLQILKRSALYRGTPKLPTTARSQVALQAIHRTGKMFERLPSTYHNKGEEDLRDHILVSLAAHEGSVTGESFNKRGKTDILYQVEGTNELVAECKFWGGEQVFYATVNQLLSYLTIRDRQTAVIFFVRNKNFTAVAREIPTYAAKHPNFVRHIGNQDDTWQEYEFRHPLDNQCLVLVSVLLYHVIDES